MSAFAAIAGLLFGAGLVVSGMTRPEKVHGFLDLAGDWDPSLAFVMAGALAVHFALFRIVRRRGSPLFDRRFHLPTRSDLDARLVLGAVVFGIGWGLGGICPGPALVDLGSGLLPAFVFVIAMAGGMVLHDLRIPFRPPPKEPRHESPDPQTALRPRELDLHLPRRRPGDA